MSTSKLSPQVIESLKDIIRDLGEKVAEVPKSFNRN